MKPSFKVVFVEKNICGSREQYTRPTKKMHMLGNTFCASQTHTKCA